MLYLKSDWTGCMGDRALHGCVSFKYVKPLQDKNLNCAYVKTKIHTSEWCTNTIRIHVGYAKFSLGFVERKSVEANNFSILADLRSKRATYTWDPAQGGSVWNEANNRFSIKKLQHVRVSDTYSTKWSKYLSIATPTNHRPFSRNLQFYHIRETGN